MFDHDLAPGLIELAQTDDVGAKARDVVDVLQGLMTTLPRGEDDRAASDDVDDRAITKLDGAGDGVVQLGEGGAVARCNIPEF